MQPEPDELAALIDTVRALDTANVPYALIGGVAVEALERAGFEKTGEFAHSVNFRHVSGEPVQLAFDHDFDAMIERTERINVAGASIAIVGREDLIAMKRRAAADPARRKSKRLRDQADIELLLGDLPDPNEGW